MAFNWTCPYCNRPQTVTQQNHSSGDFHFYTSKPDIGFIGLSATAIVCSNPDCLKVQVSAFILKADRNHSGNAFFPQKREIIKSKRLLPESNAKPQPNYIPEAIREDYIEACRICDLSPKAAATLARRCLQGMIRDFCGIRKDRLVEEIRELKKRVDEERAPKGVSDDSVEAIDAVRKIGNIGAHMEKDINLIIEVDQEEARILIELIEDLFDEWYVAREKRTARFSRIMEISDDKEKQKLLTREEPPHIESEDGGSETN